ncbi:MAG: MOSC domain-containing protein [Planctomycetota bacterium]
MEKGKGRVLALSISERRGGGKRNVETVRIRKDWGVEGDAHAGNWHRQVSLLAKESIRTMQEKGLEVHAGDFGENITTEGVDLMRLALGDKIRVGEILLEITQIGKECETPCEIFDQVGDCVMPREGLFARVLEGGDIEPGDPVILEPAGGSASSDS